MYNALKILVVTLIIVGGTFMADHNGRCDSVVYKPYTSEDEALNIQIEYIDGWKLQESRGSYGSYAQVQFIGALKDAFAPSMIVKVEESAKAGFSPVTVEALADDLVKKRMYFPDAKVLARTQTEILGEPAVDITLAYNQVDQLKSTEMNLVPFKERVLLVEKDDKFYTLRYVNPAQDFAAFEDAFLHCSQTFSLKK